jgi:hypothetical protein
MMDLKLLNTEIFQNYPPVKSDPNDLIIAFFAKIRLESSDYESFWDRNTS